MGDGGRWEELSIALHCAGMCYIYRGTSIVRSANTLPILVTSGLLLAISLSLFLSRVVLFANDVCPVQSARSRKLDSRRRALQPQDLHASPHACSFSLKRHGAATLDASDTPVDIQVCLLVSCLHILTNLY